MEQPFAVARQTLEEVRADRDWSAAERRVLEGCGTGEVVVLDGPKRPEEATEENRVRADLIRFLLAGGKKE